MSTWTTKFDLDADPEVMRYLGNGKARSRAEVEQFHHRRLQAAAVLPGLGFWVGYVERQFVGWWILEPPERADQGPIAGQAELGTASYVSTGARALPPRAPASSCDTDSPISA